MLYLIRRAWIEKLRLVLAMLISPAIPISLVSFQSTGSIWSPFFFLWGYLVFAVTGMPFAAYAYVRRTLFVCVVAGGIASIAPLLLLASLSMFETMNLNKQAIKDMFGLIAAGGVGGAIFWLILFKQKT